MFLNHKYVSLTQSSIVIMDLII